MSTVDRLEEHLAEARLFASLPSEARRRLLEEGELVRVPAGSWLFRQGEAASALFIVAVGRLEAVVEEDAGARVIRRIGQGDVVGELGVIAQATRSASVRAVRDSELLRVGRERVVALLDEQPGFGTELSRGLASLLREQPRFDQPARARAGVLAVTPLHPGTRVDGLVPELVGAIERRASVAVMDRGRPGDGGAGSEGSWGHRLQELERDHDHVVLACVASEGLGGDWNAFCLRQADRVLGVAVTDAEPPAPLPHPRLHGCELLLLADRPGLENVPRWRAALGPRAHHLLGARAGPGRGVDRAVRRILGDSVGLVLSGGGAGALAQIGAIAALRDAGVEIDRVGGTSAGAFVGAMLALGRSPAEMIETCRRELVTGNPFRDYTVPRRSLIRGRKWELLLRRLFGDVRVEQTVLDFFAISADLSRAEMVVHREGPLWSAVGASMSMPGLVPPLARDGRLLVDGGVLNSFPTDVMADVAEGPVIGVETSRPSRGSRLPELNIVEVIARATMLGSSARAARNRRRTALVIAPDVTGVGIFDFGRLDELVAAAQRALAERAS